MSSERSLRFTLSLSLIALLLCAQPSQALSRVQATFGLGQGTTVSSDGKTKFVENPMAFGFSLDHPLSDAYFIFAEHLRTYGASGTSMGLTGLGAKFYPWINPQQGRAVYNEASPYSNISIGGYSTYFGAGFGFAQASVPANSGHSAAVAVGSFLSGKAGVETAISKNWFVLGETNLAMTLIGSGSLQYFNITFGFSYSL